MAAARRRIAHLDMDAFFASVELLHRPELRGQPVVVGGRHEWHPEQDASGTWHYHRLRAYKGRGVVTTATYEARALGVGSGMGLMRAAQLAPGAILLPANFEAYREASRRFKAAVQALAPRIEDRGIDEIYIDLTDHPEDSRTLAVSLQDAVRAATGLSCSVGIAPNKLLAKLCSDLEKPAGITLLTAEEVPARIWPLPVDKINGIGPKASERLAGLGVLTIGALAAFPLDMLRGHFGETYGRWLHEAAHGIDERPVATCTRPSSISRETTFPQDLHPRQDRSALSEIFTALCVRVAEDLRRKGYRGRTIGIKLRYADFTTVSRDLTLAQPIDDPQGIRRAAGECLRRVPLIQPLRLLGVRVGGLVSCRDESTQAWRQGELPLEA